MFAAFFTLLIVVTFVRIRLRPELIFLCPSCRQPSTGRRCYRCRLEVEPDNTPSEMSIPEFLGFIVQEFVKVRIRGERVEWRQF